MDNEVLDRIRFFLEFKHWSVYKLANASGIPYSSLNNIFNRNTVPSIPTLEKICAGLNITLSEFFEYKKNPLRKDELSEREQCLVNAFQSLSVKDKDLLEAYLQGLLKK